MFAVSRHALLLERLGLAGGLLVLTFLLIHTDAAWRWDQVVYDGQIKLWSRPPPDDIIIVAIDTESVAGLGAWPWPRQYHAELLRKLTEASPQAVLLDIIFAEPSTPEADRKLAESIRDNRRTILPVLAEQRWQDAPLAETLPLPMLIAGAAGLGHTHIELDPDGIARSVYLEAGLGAPVWPSFGLAALRLLMPGQWSQLPGLRDPDHSLPSPSTWVQDHRVLIPFVGPPGSFRRISYRQVLQGSIPVEVFRHKIILIGATASGLGDTLPTPVSGFSQPMPGVEIHASIIDALRRGLMVEPVPSAWRLGISLSLALLPALIFPYLSPRGSLLATASLLALTIAGSLSALAVLRLWFAPVPALIALTLSYPLWSWRRLEYTLRYLNRELQTLSQERTVLNQSAEPDIAETLGSLTQLLPINGWALLSAKHQPIASGGMPPEPVPNAVESTAWLRHEGNLWTGLRRANKTQLFGLSWIEDRSPTEAEQRLLAELARHLGGPPTLSPQGTVEMLESRIEQVQAATDRLRQMNLVVSDSLADMTDGVLIVNAFGQIVLANSSAESYLSKPSGIAWTGRGLLEVLGQLELSESLSLRQMLADALLQQAPAQCYARTPQRDLMVQLAPLILVERPGGVIVNITDITLLKASERRRLELLGFLSHDLRSPLVSMLALTNLARARLQPSQTQEDFLLRMENHTHAILSLADDFLNLIRAESNEEIAFREIDLGTIALNALDKVWPQADQKHIRLSEDFQTEETWCHGNADLIERALVNLLTNAVKYSPPDTAISLRLARRDTWIDCCVQDQGYGIAAEELAFLFDAFRRAGGERQRAESGYGLGLAFVKVVAQRHGGSASVQSGLGKGSCFCLSLPVSSGGNY